MGYTTKVVEVGSDAEAFLAEQTAITFAGDAPEADAVTETETTEAAGNGADSADTGSDTTEKTEESKND